MAPQTSACASASASASAPAPAVPVIARAEPFDQFYRRHYRGTVALVLALSGSRAAAEDIAQDAMVAAYRRWDDVGLLDSPAAWVRRVALNRATSTYRRRLGEWRALTLLGGRRDEQAADMPEPDEQLWREVRNLPRRQAQCIALRYVLDCSVAEIADLLGCAQGTVKATLHQARQRLAAALEPEGGTP